MSRANDSPRSSRTFGLAAAGALVLAAGASGCFDLAAVSDDFHLGTHVSDWRDEVVYQVLVDRFANGDASNDYGVHASAPARYHGGDWRGLEDHLDYVQALGATAIWISPIVKNVETDANIDGYHGYWAQDLTQLNPHFGDLASLRRLVASAHAKNLKVIVDIVTNHLGQLFFYDINQNGVADESVAGGTASNATHLTEYDPDFDPTGVQSFTSLGPAGPAPIIFFDDPKTNHMPPFPDLFQSPAAYHLKGRVVDWNDPQQVVLGDFPGGLKDVKTESPAVRQAMIDVYAHWVELTDVDGFRIDTLKHVEHEFWQTFAPAVRQRLAAQGKKSFFMFGEAFDGDDALVGSFTKNQEVDSTFYFPQYYAVIRDVFQLGKATQAIQDLFAKRATDFGTAPNEGGIGVAPTKALVNFLDNHDVARFLFARPDEAALQNAFLFLFTEDGIPCVYYGDEQGFSGGNDPANREDFWPTGYATGGALFQWVSRLARLRRAYPALTRGDLKIVWATTRVADEPDAGIIAYERSGGDAASAYALVVINTSAGHESSPAFGGAPMNTSLPGGTTLVDVLHPGAAPLTVAADGSLAITVPATSGVVLVRQSDVVAGL